MQAAARGVRIGLKQNPLLSEQQKWLVQRVNASLDPHTGRVAAGDWIMIADEFCDRFQITKSVESLRTAYRMITKPSADTKKRQAIKAKTVRTTSCMCFCMVRTWMYFR